MFKNLSRRQQKAISVSALAALSTLGMAQISRAASIDINIAGNAGSSYDMSGATTAGMYPIAGSAWNNIIDTYAYDTTSGNIGGGTAANLTNTYNGASGTYLSDDSGASVSTRVSLTASFSTNGTQASGSSATAQDLLLFGSGLGTDGNGSPNPPTSLAVTITSIPYTSYDVYAYYTSGTIGHNGYITDGTTYYSISNDTAVGTTPFPGYVAASIYSMSAPTSASTSSSNTPSDYAEFYNESASSLTLTLAAQDGSAGLSLAGIQIVQVPEPATLGVLGTVSTIGLLRRRRQSRARVGGVR